MHRRLLGLSLFIWPKAVQSGMENKITGNRPQKGLLDVHRMPNTQSLPDVEFFAAAGAKVSR